MSKNLIKGYVFAVLSAVLFGCMPLMAKNIYADGVNSFTLVFLRNLVAVVPLGLLAYREAGTLAIPVKGLPAIGLIAALGCCATPMLLFCSYNYIASGTATVIHFVYPAFVILGEVLFLRKKLRPSSLLSVAFCMIGVGMFYTPGASLNLAGSLLALISGATFAGYIILLSRFGKNKVSPLLLTFYIVLFSTLISGLICLVSGSFALPATAKGWGLCVLFSLLVTVGAVVLFQQATFLIGGERVSILSTLEPITGVVIGVMIFHEDMGGRKIAGVALVLAASLLTAIMDMKRSQS